MFRQATTVVIGAGASFELGLPLGEGLKSDIISALAPDRNAYGFSSQRVQHALRFKYSQGMNDFRQFRPLQEAADRIRKGLPLALSIDNFLHTHQGDEHVESVGKMAIALTILEAESNSKLFPSNKYSFAWMDDGPRESPEPSLDTETLSDSWYIPFFQQLMSQSQRQNPREAFANLSFIIFNYDRCLEQFLWMALQDYLSISGEDAADILSGVDFIHPYGTLGHLPWQTKDASTSVSLGDNRRQDLFDVGQRLRTFTESVESALGESVKLKIAQAETVIILGFGYLDQNLSLLVPPGQSKRKRVLTTAFGIAEDDRKVIESAINRLSQDINSKIVEPGSCRDLFMKHRLELSLR